MSERVSDAGSLPAEFAIFPLPGALLLPKGKLPLNIFEPRYLAMTEDALASASRAIGMIQPDPTSVGGPTGPGLFRIGCLGRLSSFSETEDGRYLITLDGLCRFRVVTELEELRGYRRIRACFDEFAGDLRLDGDPALLPREVILTELRSYFRRGGMDANWDAIDRLADRPLLTALCMICPFPPAEKQALLEAADEQARAETLIALLRMGGPQDDDDDKPRQLS